MPDPNDDQRPEDDDADDGDEAAPRKIRLVVGHVHDCVNDCGTTLHCAEPDRCRVRGAWTCPTCLDYIDEQQINTLAKKVGRD